MSRLLLCAIVAILLADASGLMAYVSPEACTAATDTVPDGKCPALCVRCACAQPTVTTVALSLAVAEHVTPIPVEYAQSLSVGSPHDILHVPK